MTLITGSADDLGLDQEPPGEGLCEAASKVRCSWDT